ncbi:MAG: hypothetical protein VB089_06815 [Anaerolineaceae bacterium]|nr:hypothetical protein [Anaerolineaceae bacterium]
MNHKKLLVPLLLIYLLFSFACVYIVLPEDLGSAAPASSEGWSAIVTGVSPTAGGDLHIDLTLRNDTGDWSAMQAAAGKPAVLTPSGGSKSNCETVLVSSGGHRLAPGFQMRGYTGGTKAEPVTQLIYIECAAAGAVSGGKLTLDYSYVTGQYNYYEQEKNKVDDQLEINLDTVVTDLAYPIGQAVDGLVQPQDIQIVGLNKVLLTLTGVQRSPAGLEFAWQTENPGEYPSYVHIGNPPVIGADGILYGYYETPDLASVPLTPAGDKTTWSTQVTVPPDVGGLYILLSVETGKSRLFANYVIDITDK